MLNLLTKTKPWMVASLLVATSAFGQDKCQPQKSCVRPCEKICPEVLQAPTIAAYNAPARIDTRCSWDVWVDGSFTYWQPIQENMELGVANTNLSAATTGMRGNVINMNTDFKPGFKVGLGMSFDHDNWDTAAEYTWFRGTESTSSNGPNGGNIYAMWGSPDVHTSNFYNTAKETWKLKMDIVDLDLGRWYYVGTKLTFRPSFGARGAWIRQNVNVSYVNSSGAGTRDTVTVQARSHSWAVGPRFNLDTDWIIGCGFRLFGNGGADILFTRYTRASDTTTQTSVAGYSQSVKQNHINTLRTHLDTILGIGWGSYFDNNNWHIDLTAGYEFQVFFDQNMFRHYSDDVALANSRNPNGNLYVHGLTATLKLDF